MDHEHHLKPQVIKIRKVSWMDFNIIRLSGSAKVKQEKVSVYNKQLSKRYPRTCKWQWPYQKGVEVKQWHSLLILSMS